MQNGVRVYPRAVAFRGAKALERSRAKSRFPGRRRPSWQKTTRRWWLGESVAVVVQRALAKYLASIASEYEDLCMLWVIRGVCVPVSVGAMRLCL
jgi:hypothetical protein